MTSGFYRAFEDRFRGSRELIKTRLRVYLPFVEPLKGSGARALDLGCGRGEWLELLQEIGVAAHGVDLDDEMLAACRELSLSVETGEAVAFLKGLPDESQDIVSAFHLVEHLPFGELQSLVCEALRVLKPSGLLIMETPNPENLVVGTSDFYLDPTHQRPLPPKLLSILPEFYGFARTKILRLQESKDLAEKVSPTLKDVLSGISPDYAVIAQKDASAEKMALFDDAFNEEYLGLPLETLADQFENRLRQMEAMAQQAEVTVRQVEVKVQRADVLVQQTEEKVRQAEEIVQQAEAMIRQSEMVARQAEAALLRVFQSRSWRISYPLRQAGNMVRWLLHGSWAWLTFAPKSRPRRIVHKFLIRLKFFLNSRPKLKALVLNCLLPFPGLKTRLKMVGLKSPQEVQVPDYEGPEQLSPNARQLYGKLKAALEKDQRERP